MVKIAAWEKIFGTCCSLTPLVTIVLPVYNGASTLKLAIDSILWQSFQNWELIILDDASTDESLEVMRSFSDPRIRIVEVRENIGLAAGLNKAVEMAKGKYFARMDQDDISFPKRIETQLDYLESHPDVDLLASNYAVFNDKHEWLGKLSVRLEHDDICRKPWNGFYMPHPTWFGKLEWFKNHQYENYANGAEDQNLLLRSYKTSHFACMDEVLLAYRQNDRPLKKKLRARAIYTTAAFRSPGNGLCLPMTILLVQLAKGLGDIANARLDTPGLQRTLLQLRDDERRSLDTIFEKLNQAS